MVERQLQVVKRQFQVVECQTQVVERRSGPLRLNLTTGDITRYDLINWYDMVESTDEYKMLSSKR